MKQPQQRIILNAFQLVLRPVMKILLRYGIGYSEFAETVKTAFVDVASSEFGIRGRPTNISRVAVMTGLTRKEVRRIRSNIEVGENKVNVRTTPITEILSRWHSEDDFLDKNGRPRILSFSGGPSSFTNLVKKFGGDVPAGAMRTELKRMALVDEDGAGNLEVLSRSMVPPDSTDNLLTSLVHGIYPMLSTVASNTDSAVKKGDGTAQFTAYSLAIRPEDRTRLKRICYDRLAEAALSFDDLFNAYEVAGGTSGTDNDQPVVMVGLYFFEEMDKNADYKW